MIHRTLEDRLKSLFQKFPILTLMGPRQSGKTTLAKEAFSGLPYVNLEDLSLRSFAQEDPKGFLAPYETGVIIDEVQYVPDLFSYLQVFTDARDKPGQYVLTGSQQFLLNEKISQSLAGRAAITTLLPLSFDEIQKATPFKGTIEQLLFKGFYPRLYRYPIDPPDFYGSYIQTYIERDVRQIKNVSDLSLFQTFLKLCAGRTGQILNLSSLSNDCGISHVTARQWISLLEMSFVIYILKPHHKNFNKRIIKAPKLYFYDTGIAAHLLDIKTPEQLKNHYAKGALFENFVIIELLKQCYNQGGRPAFSYWRDKTGHEVDLIIEEGENLIPLEIKSGQTIQQSFFSQMNDWKKLAKQEKAYIIYGGDVDQTRFHTKVLSWKNINFQEIITL